jgi:ferredoxin
MGYKIVYDRKVCSGAGRCAGIQPEHWDIDGENRAELKGGTLNASTGKYELLISDSQLEAHRAAALICPTYAIDILDGSGKSILNLKPTSEAEKSKVPVKKAHYDSSKEWAMDPKGFFTIKPEPAEQLIRMRCYGGDHALFLVIEGKNAEEIYNTAVREGLVSLMAHAAYLGSELMKAEIAMKKNLPYVQDDPLP